MTESELNEYRDQVAERLKALPNPLSVQFIKDLVAGCNCEGYLFQRSEYLFVIVLHPHNSLEDAKYCMTKLEENRPIIVQYDYNVRLTDRAYKACLARDKQYHDNVIMLE